MLSFQTDTNLTIKAGYNSSALIYTSMIKDWSVQQIRQEIAKIRFAANDPRMDGFVTWGCKKDLYETLWFVQDELAKCSTYADEDEYVKKREQKILLKTLGKQ